MTWGEIRQTLIKEFPSLDQGLLTAHIQAEYTSLLSSRAFAESQQSAQFATVAPYRAGSLTLNGTETIAGVGTNWTAAMVGRRLAIFGPSYSWYTIMAVNSATELVVEIAPVEAAGSYVYEISQPVYELASNCDIVTLLTLPYQAPSGPCTPDISAGVSTGMPALWRQINASPSGVRRVELIPAPDDAYTIPYAYAVKVDPFNGFNTQDSPAPWILPAAILDGVRARAGNPNGRSDQMAALGAMAIRDVMHRGPTRARLPRNLVRGSYRED